MTASLNDLLGWLDSHVNYERTGPSSSPRPDDLMHDPDRRLRHLARLMELMDDPQRLFRTVHVTGTNGKTSTSRLTTGLLQAAGLSVGTYTSPHLESVNERIMANGEPLADHELAEVLDALRLLEPLLGDDRASYFELLTAAAFRFFADKPVDAAVVEVGVGGTWDATNVVDAEVAVVTNIGLDHMNYLGPTRRHIAEHKAGIVKPGATLVLAETDPALRDVFVAREPGRLLLAGEDFALARDELAVGGRLVDLRTPLARYDDVFLSLHGAHQSQNAAVALVAAEALLGQPVPDDAVREALGSATSPGRMEVVHRQPLCVVDGAHNADGARALAASVREEFGAVTGRVLVVGMLAPHDPGELLEALDARSSRLVVACTAPSPRAVPAEAIASAARSVGIPTVQVEEVGPAVREAISAAADDELVLVAGSLYVAGAARAALAG